MVTASNNEHVRDKFCRDGRPRLVLFVHPSIGKRRDDCCYPSGGSRFAGRNEDEEFHEVVIGILTARLNDENIFISNRFRNFDVDFAVGELLDGAGYERDVESKG